MESSGFQKSKVQTRTIWILWMVALLPAFGVAHYFLKTPLLGDAGSFAGIAEHMNQGAVLYKDVWDNKAPGIFFLFQLILAIGSGYDYVFHIVQFLFVWLWIGFAWHLVYHFHGKKAWPVLFLTPLWMKIFTDWPYYYSGHYTEEYGIYLLFFSCCIYLLHSRSERGFDMAILLSGILAGFAVMIKEPFAPAVALFALFIWKDAGIKKMIYFVLFAFIPVLFFALYLSLTGAWNSYFHYMKFAFGYASEGNSRWGMFINTWSNYIENIGNQWHIYPVLFFIMFIPTFSNNYQLKTRNIVWLLLLVLLGCNVFIMLGNVSYGHYMLPIVFVIPLLFIFGIIYLLNRTSSLLRKLKYGKIWKIVPSIIFIIWIYSPLKESISHMAWKQFPTKVSESQEKLQVLKHTQGAKTVFAEAQDMGRVYFYSKKGSGMPYPSPYFVYFINDKNPDAASKNVKKLVDAFHQNPPEIMITKKDLNAGFIIGGLSEEIASDYPIADSMLTSEGTMVYFRIKK